MNEFKIVKVLINNNKFTATYENNGTKQINYYDLLV